MDKDERRIVDPPCDEPDEFGGGRVVNWWPLLFLVDRENGLFIESEFRPFELIPAGAGRMSNGTRVRRAAIVLLDRGILPMKPGRVEPDDWPSLRDLLIEHGVFSDSSSHDATVSPEPDDVHV